MTKRRLSCRRLPALCLVLSLAFCWSLSAYASEGAPQRQESEQTLEQLGTAIHTSLAALKARSQSLTEELQGQKLIVEEYKTKLNELSICLTNTNEKLYTYETKLVAYEQKLKQQKKWLRIGMLLVAAFILVRMATLILRAKGIKLPELLNILL